MKGKILFRIRNILQLTAACGAIWMCLRYGNECSRGILNGILFCIEILVPSLFLLMTAAAFLVNSSAAEAVAKPLDGLSKALFRLPYPSAAVILLALIGGYPVGARCAAMMYERGSLTAEQAEKTALIAVCAGPGFLVNFVGRALLRSAQTGYLLLAAEIIGVLLTGIVIGRTVKCEENPPISAIVKRRANLLTTSVADASRATFHMCSMVVLCAAMIEVVTEVSPDKGLTEIISAALEITSGCTVLCKGYPLTLTAFFIGFGGLAVHLQIFAAVGEMPLRKVLFFLYRIIQGIFTAALTYTLLLLFSPKLDVFNSAEVTLTAAKSATLVGSAALVLCSLGFVASINKVKRKDQETIRR